MALNVNREVEDTFYRYKMPCLAAKVEGKGNGIKTVIVNVSDIAKALSRKAIYVTKYFGCELGAQIHVDEKNERYIVNGAHDAKKLQELLHVFIKKFVLCQSCGNPETTMHVRKKGATVSTTCKACGAAGQLDATHRLTQYIVKNPPDPETPPETGKPKKGKKVKAADKINDERPVANNGTEIEGQQSPVENGNDNDDWVEDTTEAAQMQRMNELTGLARTLAINVGSEKSETERASIFCTHLSQLKREGSLLYKKHIVKKEAEDLDFGPRVVLILAEALFDVPDTIVQDIKTYAPIFMLFTRSGENNIRAQQYTLHAMCKLIEHFQKDNLIAKACHMLKQLYDCDIVEEEVILKWATKESKKGVSKELRNQIIDKCAPMIKWLQEADEEDSDGDSDDDSDSEVENSSPSTLEATGPSTVNGKDQSEDEDVDIDAI